MISLTTDLIKGAHMLTLNVIALMSIAFGVGYYLGKGQIIINKVMSKEAEEKMLKMYEENTSNIQAEMDKIMRAGVDIDE